MTENFEYRVLGHAHIKSAVDVMTHAFLNSPSYVEIFRGDEQSRIPRLEWTLNKNIRAILTKDPQALRGIVIPKESCSEQRPKVEEEEQGKVEDGMRLEKANDDDEVVAAFMLINSSKELTPWEMLKAGLGWMPFHCGFGTTIRLIKALDLGSGQKEKSDADHDDVMWNVSKSNPVLFLERMAVSPQYQRKGLGSTCIKNICKEAQQLKLPIRLATQEEGNVNFYSRFGFETRKTNKYNPDDPQYAYTSWLMELPIEQKSEDS